MSGHGTVVKGTDGQGPGFTARVFIVQALAMTVLLAVCGIVLVTIHRSYHENEEVNAGKALCRLLAAGTAGVTDGGRDRLAAMLRILMPLEGIERVRVISPRGLVLFERTRDGAVTTAGDGKVAVPIGIDGAGEPLWSGTDRLLRFWFPARSGPEARIVAYVNVDIGRNRPRDLEGAAAAWVAAILMTVLLAWLASLAVARMAARPLRARITEARKALAEDATGGTGPAGDYDAAIREAGDLLARLARRDDALRQEVEEIRKELGEARIQARQAMCELKEIQAQVIQAEKMAALGMLVSGVAHEINNTMNIISGALPPLEMQMEKLRHRQEGEEREKTLANLATLMGNIREGAARTSEIVRNLQDFSRSRPMEYRNADPCRILDTTLFLMRPEIKERVEIIREYESGGATIPCYPGQLGQVFMNIILNSIQAMEGRGRLLVRTGTEEGRFIITIADDGPGIGPEIRERVFDPFFTTKRAGHGTGLGLSVSYTIIRGHHGGIRVAPSPFGKGCAFVIDLPMDGPAAQPGQEGRPPHGSPATPRWGRAR